MYLKTLTIRRFRSCDDVTVDLRDDLTVLVGENNGGKSNVIDALRLLTAPLSGRRDRYPEDDDLRRGATEAAFEVEGLYADLGDTLKGLLLSGVPDVTKNEAIFGFTHETRSTTATRGRTSYWAGQLNNPPEAGSADLIRHVYLPALRDAHHALGSGSGARVMALFRHFLPKDQEGEFLRSVQRDAELPDTLNTINAEIGASLGSLSSGVRPQDAKLDFAAESLLDVARALRFRLADAGFSLEDVRASGLGYSNLLYMATVMVELTRARESDLTLFLVEEPEAHLHPQLQMLVLEFLLERARESKVAHPAAGEPEGRIQVIVSTHSPNLTAWVSPQHLVVVRSCLPEAPVPAADVDTSVRRDAQPHSVADGDPPPRAIPTPRSAAAATVTIPIARLEIDRKMIEKIGRYLDVSRSAVLFGNRALLVEGVAESLLLPVFAKHFVLQGDREAYLRFRGAVIVAIDGVDFRPYVEVLLRPYKASRISDRVVVVTDADPSVPGNRGSELESLAQEVGAPEALHVFMNENTLEHELMLAGNETALKDAFLALHPHSAGDWRDAIEDSPPADRPTRLLELIQRKRTRKGDLAQAIAAHIESNRDFRVPDYLRGAIQKISAP